MKKQKFLSRQLLKKIIQRLKIRNQQFKKHPITKDCRAKALSRYIMFNIINRIKNEIKYKWIDGLIFSASKGDAGIVGNIYYGLQEFNESMFILHFLEADDVFLDVGANVGHYSLLASGIRKCNSISIEPIPETFNKLNKQIRLNKLTDKILSLNIGVGNKISNSYFSTDKGTMNRIVDNDYKNSIKIPINTIDNLCQNKKISVMKIDIEGYEKFALEGSKSTLKNENLKAIIIEMNNNNQIYGIESKEVYNILIKNGFLPYRYCPFDRKLIRLESFNKEQFNTIFIRDLNLVSIRLKKSSKIKIWGKLI